MSAKSPASMSINWLSWFHAFLSQVFFIDCDEQLGPRAGDMEEENTHYRASGSLNFHTMAEP